jgi:hypothetical protein
MIGLSRDKTKIFSLACDGKPGRASYTLKSAAELLKDIGVFDELLVDEGFYVFQLPEIGEQTLSTIKVAGDYILYVRVPQTDKSVEKKLT